MVSKIKTYLGFASKAGKLSFGMAKTEEALKKGKAKFIVFANDISEKSKKEILFLSDKYGVAAAGLDFSGDELTGAIGFRCGIAAINDESLAQAIENSIKSN